MKRNENYYQFAIPAAYLPHMEFGDDSVTIHKHIEKPINENSPNNKHSNFQTFVLQYNTINNSNSRFTNIALVIRERKNIQKLNHFDAIHTQQRHRQQLQMYVCMYVFTKERQ